RGGERPATVAALLGVAMPTGANNVKDDAGDRVEAHLQPGTGAWSGTAGLSLGVDLPGGMFDTNAMGRWNGTNQHGYQYGHAFLANLGYTSPPKNGWQLLGQFNGRWADRDRTEDGDLDPNTGGTVVYFAPALRWVGGNALGVEASAQFPVIESLYGIQDEHTTARIAVSMGR